MGCSPPGSSVHEISQARILEWVAISFSRGSSDPGIEPRFPVLQADSLPTELQGKPTPKPSRKISELGQLNQRNPLPYQRPSQGFMGGTVGSVGWELVVWLQIETHVPKSKSQLHPAPLTEPLCASIFSSLKRECNSFSLIAL